MNSVMNRIVSMKNQWEFGAASAMAWIYFAIVIAVIIIIAGAVRRFKYYEND